MYIDGEKNGGSNVKTENGKNPNCEKEKEEEEDDQPIVPPPDGGWGWAVVFASFMIHVIGKYDLQKTFNALFIHTLFIRTFSLSRFRIYFCKTEQFFSYFNFMPRTNYLICFQYIFLLNLNILFNT